MRSTWIEIENRTVKQVTKTGYGRGIRLDRYAIITVQCPEKSTAIETEAELRKLLESKSFAVEKITLLEDEVKDAP